MTGDARVTGAARGDSVQRGAGLDCAGTLPATVGVDVGGTKVLGVLLAADGTIVSEDRLGVPVAIPAQPDGGRSRGVHDAIVVLLRRLEVAAAERGEAVGAVGVGLPGQVDRAGRLHVSPNLPQGEGLDLADSLPASVGLAVVVENDATCAAVGEWLVGAGRGAQDMVLVTVGTGIGVGVVAAGHVVRGAAGYAGEAGHMVVQPGGRPCPCGRRGCWERYASGDTLGRIARQAAAGGAVAGVLARAGGDLDAIRGEHVTAAAAAGDGEAETLVDELAHWLALGITNLCAVLDPGLVVVGGGLVEAGALLLDPVVRALHDPQIAGRYEAPTLVAAELGARAGAVGAAVLARSAMTGPGAGGHLARGPAR